MSTKDFKKHLLEAMEDREIRARVIKALLTHFDELVSLFKKRDGFDGVHEKQVRTSFKRGVTPKPSSPRGRGGNPLASRPLVKLRG